MPRRSHLDPPIIPHVIIDAYLEGDNIENLARVWRVGTRKIRDILTDHGVTIRSWNGGGNSSRQYRVTTRQPGGRVLSPQELQRLRRAIGYDPSWVSQPEYMYDREYDDEQRQAPPGVDRMAAAGPQP